MSPTAVVPVRSFRLGKRRLAPHVTGPQRSLLAALLADRVIKAATAAGFAPLLVTADSEVAAWADERKIVVVEDPGDGLNAACHAGVAASGNGRWLVIHSDLPLISADDLIDVARLLESGRDVIAPSSDGGTSILSAADRVDFSYGPASFHRHLVRLDDPVVVTRVGFLHDLDTPRDFESATRLGALG